MRIWKIWTPPRHDTTHTHTIRFLLHTQIPHRYELSRLIFRFVYLHCGITTSSSVSLFQKSSTFFRKAKIKTTGKMFVKTTFFFLWHFTLGGVSFASPWAMSRQKEPTTSVWGSLFCCECESCSFKWKVSPHLFRNYSFHRTPYASFSLPVARTCVTALTKMPFIFCFLRFAHRHKSRRTS